MFFISASRGAGLFVPPSYYKCGVIHLRLVLPASAGLIDVPSVRIPLSLLCTGTLRVCASRALSLVGLCFCIISSTGCSLCFTVRIMDHSYVYYMMQ